MNSKKINFFPVWVKVVGSLLFLTLLPLGSFFSSTYKYQEIINEGSRIADIHCMIVNPLIIERKNSYVISMDKLLKEDVEGYYEEIARYMDISTKYVKEEKDWINLQTDFLNRPDVRRYVPQIILDGEQILIEQRDAEIKSSLSTMKMFDTDSDEESIKLMEDTKRYSDLATQKEEKYWRLVDEKKKETDPREWFIDFPESQCPDENFEIPDSQQDLEDLLNPPTVEDTPLT